MNDTFVAGKLYKSTFVDYLPSSSGKIPIISRWLIK